MTKEAHEILNKLLRGNKKYQKNCQEVFEDLKSGQSPKVTLLTCGDSRVPASIFGIDALNEIFTVKNIGNQIRISEGSLKYPILHLKTPIVIILGHTGCGAIKAATSDYRKEDDAIQRELIGLKNSILRAQHEIKKDVSDELLKQCMISEINVDHQIDKLLLDYNIKPKIENQEVVLIGMMFDIHDIYEKGCAKIFITNINGNRDVDKINTHPVLKLFSEKEDVVKRLT
ncbi:hypothetical protein GF327_04930 [Candidatus Woesearchaeota archaeon]|nr:hypothetical protein [Candidatus Woesearchaeota archaeon]